MGFKASKMLRAPYKLRTHDNLKLAYYSFYFYGFKISIFVDSKQPNDSYIKFALNTKGVVVPLTKVPTPLCREFNDLLVANKDYIDKTL